MGIIKKIKKIVNPFEEPQPITNGNKYDVYQDLKNQEQIDLNSINEYLKHSKNTVQDINTLLSAIKAVNKKLIDEKNIQPYFLLQSQANYFCGTCRFDTKDLKLKRMVINVIRCAFLNGIAGIYVNKTLNILEPVYLTQLEYGIDGNLKSCKKLPLNTILMKMNESKSLVKDEDLIGFITLNEKECENLCIFSWGTMGYSAWLTIWPFVNLQHLMLTICIINAFVFNKKWIYRINNFTSISDEIELFFDPTNPFVVNLGVQEELSNRFASEDIASTKTGTDAIDYYNKLISIYYHLFGRKINNDVKKERNISSEVEASQENYDVVQSDWLNQFAIFIDELKEKSGIDIWVEKENEAILAVDADNKEDEVENGTDNQ